MIMTLGVCVLTMKGTVRSVRRRLQLLLGISNVQRSSSRTWRTRWWSTVIAIIRPNVIGSRSRRVPLRMQY